MSYPQFGYPYSSAPQVRGPRGAAGKPSSSPQSLPSAQAPCHAPLAPHPGEGRGAEAIRRAGPTFPVMFVLHPLRALSEATPRGAPAGPREMWHRRTRSLRGLGNLPGGCDHSGPGRAGPHVARGGQAQKLAAERNARPAVDGGSSGGLGCALPLPAARGRTEARLPPFLAARLSPAVLDDHQLPEHVLRIGGPHAGRLGDGCLGPGARLLPGLREPAAGHRAPRAQLSRGAGRLREPLWQLAGLQQLRDLRIRGVCLLLAGKGGSGSQTPPCHARPPTSVRQTRFPRTLEARGESRIPGFGDWRSRPWLPRTQHL